jgi:iron complex transport system substrate-binding protein
MEDVASAIIGSALFIHRRLGPGLYENVYESILEYELLNRGFHVERQKHVPLQWGALELRDAYSIDLLVEDLVVVEVKSVERLAPNHLKQVLTYLKLSDKPLGLLLNFGQATLRDGIHRVINGYPRSAYSPHTLASK